MEIIIHALFTERDDFHYQRRVLQSVAVCCTSGQQSCFIAPSHTEWRRPIVCLKLRVIFRKRTTIYRALLRKYEWWPFGIK